MNHPEGSQINVITTENHSDSVASTYTTEENANQKWGPTVYVVFSGFHFIHQCKVHGLFWDLWCSVSQFWFPSPYILALSLL